MGNNIITIIMLIVALGIIGFSIYHFIKGALYIEKNLPEALDNWKEDIAERTAQKLQNGKN